MCLGSESSGYLEVDWIKHGLWYWQGNYRDAELSF